MLTPPAGHNPALQAKAKTLAALPNLGPASAQMLLAAGIDSPQQLQQLGAVAAYWQVKQQRQTQGLGTSLNLLWALAGALQNRHWAQLDTAQRSSLLLAVDALADLSAHSD